MVNHNYNIYLPTRLISLSIYTPHPYACIHLSLCSCEWIDIMFHWAPEMMYRYGTVENVLVAHSRVKLGELRWLLMGEDRGLLQLAKGICTNHPTIMGWDWGIFFHGSRLLMQHFFVMGRCPWPTSLLRFGEQDDPLNFCVSGMYHRVSIEYKYIPVIAHSWQDMRWIFTLEWHPWTNKSSLILGEGHSMPFPKSQKWAVKNSSPRGLKFTSPWYSNDCHNLRVGFTSNRLAVLLWVLYPYVLPILAPMNDCLTTKNCGITWHAHFASLELLVLAESFSLGSKF